MKILIGDSFEQVGLDGLSSLGCQITHDSALKDDSLRDAIGQTSCDILIVRGTKVTAEMLDASPNLSLVLRAGAGYNTIDVAHASRSGIYVANCPGKNAAAVAELALGLMLALDRRIVDASIDLKAGRWKKKLYSEAEGIMGRTLGIIGMGQIGQLVAERAAAFGMNVIAWSRSLTPEFAEACGVTAMKSILDVAREADVLTVHVAATPETRAFMNGEVFEAMKPGSTFINTSRGEVVDYDALLSAMSSRSLRVGLDVFEKEPAGGEGEISDRIMQAGGIVAATPHIGASTQQAQNAIAIEAVRVVGHYVRTGEVLNCVNRLEKSIARAVLLVRHANKPGVLAHVLNIISHAEINIEEMENVIYDGAHAACAQIALDGPLSSDDLGKIRAGNRHILGVSQKIVEA